MKSRSIRSIFGIVMALLLSLMVAVGSAETYKKVYGETLKKLRVRSSASSSAQVIDNIVKGACVYITTSKTSGGTTYLQVKYVNSDGTKSTGWVTMAQDGTTYVNILTDAKAKSKFSVSGGGLPDNKVGTFSKSKRESSSSGSSTYIQKGSSGSAVEDLQKWLKALGYYSGSITGNAGSKTVAAIKAFQEKKGITADGVAGPDTISAIKTAYKNRDTSSDDDDDDDSSSSSSSSKSADISDLSTADTLYNIDWFKNKTSIIKMGVKLRATCTITDYATGISFKVKVQATGNHADVEPLTAADTKKLCSIYNVSTPSKINYKRRGAVLKTSSGYMFAVSIYGTPHGLSTISGNNYDGQFCVHFKNSKTTGSATVDSAHQTQIANVVSGMKKDNSSLKVITSL